LLRRRTTRRVIARSVMNSLDWSDDAVDCSMENGKDLTKEAKEAGTTTSRRRAGRNEDGLAEMAEFFPIAGHIGLRPVVLLTFLPSAYYILVCRGP
jgi:hypothetical protein